MGAKLDALLELQSVESQIAEIRRQLGRRERAVRAQQKKVDSARAALASEQTAIRRTQADVDELNVDVESRNANIDKLRTHLNSVKTNKEYSAILSQMNNEKADTRRIEERVLEMMEQIEARRKQLGTLEEAVKAEEARLHTLQGELQQAQNAFADRLRTLEQQRADATAGIDSETLMLFERLSERYEGEALAEIMRINPRRDEFVCEGCNMSLSPESYNQVATRDEIKTCNTCGRILYIKK